MAAYPQSRQSELFSHGFFSFLFSSGSSLFCLSLLLVVSLAGLNSTLVSASPGADITQTGQATSSPRAEDHRGGLSGFISLLGFYMPRSTQVSRCIKSHSKASFSLSEDKVSPCVLKSSALQPGVVIFLPSSKTLSYFIPPATVC